MGKRRDRKREAAEASEPKKPRSSKAAWKLMDRSTSLAAAAVAPAVATGAWRLVTGKRPPTSADNPEIDTREAIVWALVGGALVEVVKVAVRRRTAQYWVASTGELPPGMKAIHAERVQNQQNQNQQSQDQRAQAQ